MAQGFSPVLVRRFLCSLSILLVLAVSALGQPYTFEQVAAGLKYPDAATRMKAIGMLRDAQYPEAAAAIGSVLTDPDAGVQLTAIDALRTLFMTRPIERRRRIGFVVEVRGSSAWEEAFAAGPLVLAPKTVPVEVLAGLVAAIQDANPQVRVEAFYAFGMLAPLGDASSSAASPAGAVIKAGLAWTMEALRRGDRMLQVAAPRVAGRILENCGVNLSSSSNSTSSSCADVGNALIEAINSRDAAVRRGSMQALGQLRYEMAAQALGDQFSYYQRGPDAAAALVGLAGIGLQTSVPRFRDLLGSSDATFRRLAVEGIARSGDKSLQADLDRLGQRERSVPVLLALHYAWLRLGGSAAPDRLVAALRDFALRRQAQHYLLDLSPSIAQALAGSLQDPSAETRALVADILGFSGDSRVIPALEAATRDADPSAAAAAQRAVEQIRRTKN